MNLETHSFFQSDISLSQIISFFSKDKKVLYLFIGIFSVTGILYSLSLPNIYASKGVVYLQPSMNFSDSKNNLIDLISGNNNTNQSKDIAFATLTSKEFIDHFYSINGNAKKILAVKSYSKREDLIKFDNQVLAIESPFFGHSSQDRSDIFLANLIFEVDDDSPLIHIGFRSMSPLLSTELSLSLIREINNFSRDNEILRSEKRLDALKENLRKDDSLGIRSFIGNVIEQELKTIMLVKSDDFLFRIIEHPYLPEVKESPMRALICIYFAIFGFIFGISYIVLKQIKQNFRRDSLAE